MTALVDPISSTREDPGALAVSATFPRAVMLAAVAHLVVALALAPVAGQPYDLASLTGASEAWMKWGVPLLYHWKFGFDLTVMSVGAQGLRFVLTHAGIGGAAAIAIAWKLPLVLADILVAITLLDIGRRVGARQPSLAPVLWLLSPVSVWVSAGHGQVEPLAVLALVVSIDMLIRGRVVAAGIATGLGIGVEYLPVLALAVAALLAVTGGMRLRRALAFAAVAGATTAACFVPTMLSPVGRASLFSGLSSTASVASHPGAPGGPVAVGASLWGLLDVAPGRLWLVLAASCGAALIAVLIRSSRGGQLSSERAAVVGGGGLVLCIVLLDPGSLPQFGDLTLGALCLVALVAPLSPLAVIVGPALQVAAGFLFVYGGTFQSYWYDMWAGTGDSGWPFPQSLVVSDALARASSLVVFAGLILAMARRPLELTKRLAPLSRAAAVVIGALGLAFLGVWSAQPAFWRGVAAGGPADLVDTALFTASHPATMIKPNARGVTASFDAQLVRVAQALDVHSTMSVSVETSNSYDSEAAGVAHPVNGSVEIELAGWPTASANVQAIWVNVLLGRANWITPAAAAADGIALDANGCQASPMGTNWTSPGWAIVTFLVPARCVPQDGALQLAPVLTASGGPALHWDGGVDSRWVVVHPSSGTGWCRVNGRDHRGTFSTGPATWGTHGSEQAALLLKGVRVTAAERLSAAEVGGAAGRIRAVTLNWPAEAQLDRRIGATGLAAIGVADASIAVVGGWLVARQLFRGVPRRG